MPKACQTAWRLEGAQLLTVGLWRRLPHLETIGLAMVMVSEALGGLSARESIYYIRYELHISQTEHLSCSLGYHMTSALFLGRWCQHLLILPTDE
jgi:hypothetical protein